MCGSVSLLSMQRSKQAHAWCPEQCRAWYSPKSTAPVSSECTKSSGSCALCTGIDAGDASTVLDTLPSAVVSVGSGQVFFVMCRQDAGRYISSKKHGAGKAHSPSAQHVPQLASPTLCATWFMLIAAPVLLLLLLATKRGDDEAGVRIMA